MRENIVSLCGTRFAHGERKCDTRYEISALYRISLRWARFRVLVNAIFAIESDFALWIREF